MTIREAFLISASWILAGLLLAAPSMAQQSTQESEPVPVKSEASSKVQAMARSGARAKALSTPIDRQPAPRKQIQALQDRIAVASFTDETASGDNGSTAATNSDTGGNNTPAPQSPQRTKGAPANDEQLRKDSQNPIANLISFPLQNNTNMRIEPADRNQNVLNIQPVIPVSLNDKWQMIIRWITPIVWQPIPDVKELGFFGLGDMQPTFFFSPKKPSFGKLIWGVGPALQIPTATNRFLGQGKFCLGPGVVALVQPDPWTIGVLVNNVWSVAPDNGRANVNQMLLQYFVNYNLAKGWYIDSSPIL